MRIFTLLSAFFAGASTLQNGIQIYELPQAKSGTDEFDVIAGYRAGIRSEGDPSGDLAAVVAEFLKSTPSARSIALAAYGSGGKIEFVSDLERTGIQATVPAWARPVVVSSLSQFISETPQKHPELVDRAIQAVKIQRSSAVDVRVRVEGQLRLAMLGSGSGPILNSITRMDVEQFFSNYYGTDRVFVVMGGDSPDLKAVSRRNSLAAAEITGTEKSHRVPGAADFRLESDMDEGAVIFGTSVPSIFYRNWYAFLMLDRLAQRVLSEQPRTILRPALESYYYTLEVPVPSGQTAESVESTLREELNRLQYIRASDIDLEAARQNAIQFLESSEIQRWFISLGVPERRLEGLEWVRSFSADDMRAAARDLVESKPVVVSWSPKVRVLRLQVESLSKGEEIKAAPTPQLPVHSDLVRNSAFPPHLDPAFIENVPMRLKSGVSVVQSSAHAVFTAPDSLRFLEKSSDPESIQRDFGAIRADRILVLAPASLLEETKEVWSHFRGNDGDSTPVIIKGKVTSAYVPALLVLKMMLDRRLIEAGLRDDVRLNIRVIDGALLSVHGTDSNQILVKKWIDEIASRPAAEPDLEWAREAAIHHLNDFQVELQSIAWEWNSIGVLTDFHMVSPSQIQDVAKLSLLSL